MYSKSTEKIQVIDLKIKTYFKTKTSYYISLIYVCIMIKIPSLIPKPETTILKKKQETSKVKSSF